MTGSEGEERPGLLRSARGMVAGPGSGDQGLIKGLKSRAMNSVCPSKFTAQLQFRSHDSLTNSSQRRTSSTS